MSINDSEELVLEYHGESAEKNIFQRKIKNRSFKFNKLNGQTKLIPIVH